MDKNLVFGLEMLKAQHKYVASRVYYPHRSKLINESFIKTIDQLQHFIYNCYSFSEYIEYLEKQLITLQKVKAPWYSVLSNSAHDSVNIPILVCEIAIDCMRSIDTRFISGGSKIYEDLIKNRIE